MIIYVNTKIDKQDYIISVIADKQGMGPAMSTVQHWYNEYNEFLFDDETLDMIMYKKAYSGYWEAIPANLVKYRKK